MISTAAKTPEVSAHHLRAYPCVCVDFDATVRAQSTEQVAMGTVVDLSGNGLRLTLGRAPKPGSELSILIQFDGDSILTSAEVIRSTGHGDPEKFEVCCRFID
jgi:hypothetical protein